MTKQEAIDLVKLRLGSRDDADLDALIVAELVSSQAELEGAAPYPWFCVTENASTNTAVNEPRVALPTDFVIENDELLLELSTDGGVTYPTILEKASYDAIRAKYGDTPGIPKVYSLVGTYFILGPVPDAAYKIRMKYQGRDTTISALAAGATNLWLTNYADYLVNHVGMAVASWVKDQTALKVFSDRFTQARNRVIILETARDEANRDRMRGDE